MDVEKAMERTFEALKQCPKALERLNHVMDHTGMTEDGERLFINAQDAAEVFTILFMAWSGGGDSLDDLVRYMDDEKDRAITGIELMKVKSETDDTVEFEDVTIDTPAEVVVIAADWT